MIFSESRMNVRTLQFDQSNKTPNCSLMGIVIILTLKPYLTESRNVFIPVVSFDLVQDAKRSMHLRKCVYGLANRELDHFRIKKMLDTKTKIVLRNGKYRTIYYLQCKTYLYLWPLL